MKLKFNAYEKTLSEFLSAIYVVCPKCENQAIVRSTAYLKEVGEKEIKLICTKCGMNKFYSEASKDKWNSEAGRMKYKNQINRGNIDPYFRLTLWLQKEMPDGILWAYNYEHLDFLENHVSAELRNRENSPMRNKSLGSRLPKWMTSKKNRSEILSGIEKLKQK